MKKLALCVISAMLAALLLFAGCGDVLTGGNAPGEAETASGAETAYGTETASPEAATPGASLQPEESAAPEETRVTIVLPDFPQEARLDDFNKTRVESVTYRFEGRELIFSARITKIEENREWSYSGFLYRILDADGNPIKAGPITTKDLGVGESTGVEWRMWIQDLNLPAGDNTVYFEIKDLYLT